MSSYLLPCTCGRQVVVTPSEAGNRITCSCGAVLEVPPLRAMRRLRPAESTAEVSPPVSQWGAGAALLLLGAVVLLLGGGFCAYVWVHRPRVVDVDSLRPVDTWFLWQQLRHLPRRTARHDLLIGTQHMYRLWMMLALAVVALGCALVAAGLLMARKPAARPSDSPKRH